VNDKHEAVLTDFGLSRILETSGFTNKLTGGTCRWMAHELIAPRDDDDDYSPPVTTATDVWAFAMTVIEVRLLYCPYNMSLISLQILTGRIPFSHIKYDTAVILSVIKNGRPLRQTSPEIRDETWSVLQRCWDTDTARRPSMRSLALYFDISHWFFPQSLSASQVHQIFHPFNENTDRGSRHSGSLVNWFGGCIGRCKRVLGLSRSTHETPQKRRDELPYRCNWPRCREGFRTLRDCQEHELHRKHFLQTSGKCYESIRLGVP
jgi:serine/threonine protein kinase